MKFLRLEIGRRSAVSTDSIRRSYQILFAKAALRHINASFSLLPSSNTPSFPMKRPDPMIELITKPSGGSSYPRSASPSRSEPFTSSSISVSISDATSVNTSSHAHEHEHVEDINAPYGLRELEQGWRALQPFLLRRGYSLRRRYWPGWVGSWVGTPLDPLECEDSIVVVRRASPAASTTPHTPYLRNNQFWGLHASRSPICILHAQIMLPVCGRMLDSGSKRTRRRASIRWRAGRPQNSLSSRPATKTARNLDIALLLLCIPRG